jgi:hypothetical protein
VAISAQYARMTSYHMKGLVKQGQLTKATQFKLLVAC